jgi:hypothetical protein
MTYAQSVGIGVACGLIVVALLDAQFKRWGR